jgi:prepilin-type N-terminal cleavage/methylation domain-containing protein
MPRRALRQLGVTLAEMLVVTALLALVASLAMPTASPLITLSNGMATSEVIRAIRFAQREAVRTGAWHTVQIDTNAQTLRVYRLTTSGTVTEDTSITVQNPIDKKKYDLAFGASSGPVQATVTLVDFDYGPVTNQNTLSFAPDGTPGLLSGRGPADVQPLTAAQVTIQLGGQKRSLAVDVLTGRVSG